jgi:AraC family transcriptional regulator
MDVAFLPPLSTYGQPVAARDFEGFALSIGAHRPGEVIPAHRHSDDYQWCLTLEGGFEEWSGARSQACGAGSLLIRPPDCVHADRFSAARGLCLNLFPRGGWLEAQGLSALSDSYTHRRSRRLLALGRELAAALQAPADADLPLTVEALVAEMLTSAVRLGGLLARGCPAWLAAAVDQIEADPAADVRLGALAQHAGVSAGHLARAFRATFGCSVGAYARRRRLARAASMIRTRELTLAEIAAAVGFYDQAHFTRAFKAQHGVTPAAFRKSR